MLTARTARTPEEVAQELADQRRFVLAQLRRGYRGPLNIERLVAQGVLTVDEGVAAAAERKNRARS